MEAGKCFSPGKEILKKQVLQTRFHNSPRHRKNRHAHSVTSSRHWSLMILNTVGYWSNSYFLYARNRQSLRFSLFFWELYTIKGKWTEKKLWFISSQPCGHDNPQTALELSGPCTEHMLPGQLWLSVAPCFTTQVTMSSSLTSPTSAYLCYDNKPTKTMGY